jgi:hypothetical protein
MAVTLSLEKYKQAHAITENARKEEFKNFGIGLEFLLSRKKEWREILKQHYSLTRHRYSSREGGKAGQLTKFRNNWVFCSF